MTELQPISLNTEVDVLKLIFTAENEYMVAMPIRGLIAIQRPFNRDDRGSFQEIARITAIERVIGEEIKFLQSSWAHMFPGSFKGIHAEDQHKLGTPTGLVYSAIVDLRPGSLTFKQWIMFKIDNSGNNPRTSLFLPKGMGNSVLVPWGAPACDYFYLVTQEYDPENSGRGVRFDDPELAIPWPIKNPIISDRDRAMPTLAEFIKKYYG